ncbi:unnamed protein product [Spirodela intermedia]|uniref:Uncharacterized protein n=1 Tax=Spirodela intermedia TaxID=51605 RepID=A0ABN7EBF9_SPIIN|nr:unnamed protein product [Spirodela intermedia]
MTNDFSSHIKQEKKFGVATATRRRCTGILSVWEVRPMKWVVESSPAAVTRRSGKTATLRLSAAVTRRRGAGWSKRRLFITSGTLSESCSFPFSRMYDHSLPHSRLATGDVEGEWRTRAPIGPSHSSPCSRLLSD